MSQEDKKIIASWHINLHVDCPACNRYIDLLEQWSMDEMYDVVQVGETKDIDFEWEVICSECQEEFIVKGFDH